MYKTLHPDIHVRGKLQGGAQWWIKRGELRKRKITKHGVRSKELRLDDISTMEGLKPPAGLDLLHTCQKTGADFDKGLSCI